MERLQPRNTAMSEQLLETGWSMAGLEGCTRLETGNYGLDGTETVQAVGDRVVEIGDDDGDGQQRQRSGDPGHMT